MQHRKRVKNGPMAVQPLIESQHALARASLVVITESILTGNSIQLNMMCLSLPLTLYEGPKTEL
jgi:hypothetical protein